MNLNKHLGLWMSCALLCVGTSSAMAFELKTNFYLSGGAGASQYDLSLFEDYAKGDPDVVYEDESEGIAYSLTAGWNFVDQFSVELFYMDFGSWEATQEDIDSFTGELDDYDKDEGDISGFGLAARYDVAVTSRFDAYIRLGMFSWDMDIESSGYNYVYQEEDRGTIGFDGTDLFAALGMKYALSDKIFLFAEVNALDSELEKDFGDGDKLSEDFGVTSIIGGVQYYFSAPTRKRIDGSSVQSDAERNRDITACDPKYKDISGVMCEQ